MFFTRFPEIFWVVFLFQINLHIGLAENFPFHVGWEKDRQNCIFTQGKLWSQLVNKFMVLNKLVPFWKHHSSSKVLWILTPCQKFLQFHRFFFQVVNYLHLKLLEKLKSCVNRFYLIWNLFCFHFALGFFHRSRGFHIIRANHPFCYFFMRRRSARLHGALERFILCPWGRRIHCHTIFWRSKVSRGVERLFWNNLWVDFIFDVVLFLLFLFFFNWLQVFS